MTVGCNIWMICLKLNGFFYDPSHVLQLSQFVWTLRSSEKVVFNSFLVTDTTDRSKISGDQKRFFIALSLCPISFFANTPFNIMNFGQFVLIFFIVLIFFWVVRFFRPICTALTVITNSILVEKNIFNSHKFKIGFIMIKLWFKQTQLQYLERKLLKCLRHKIKKQPIFCKY